MFGTDMVRSRLVALSHHCTEKDVKRHELFEKKKGKDDEKKSPGCPLTSVVVWPRCDLFAARIGGIL